MESPSEGKTQPLFGACMRRHHATPCDTLDA
jgi:hypothetical protein